MSIKASIFYSFVFLSTLSCKTGAGSNSIPEGFVEGTVSTRYVEEGCKHVILVKQDSNELILNPVNLEEKFKKDQQKIVFKYKATRMKHPDNCFKGKLVFIEKTL